nr:potassium-transporting ATPase subunit C [Tessaracoccus coleopterorum]
MTTVSRQVGVALRALALFTVLLGLVYPAVVTVIGQVALPVQANGSLLRAADGTVVGSSLVGQSFLDASGRPLAATSSPGPPPAVTTAGLRRQQPRPREPRPGA